MYYISIHRRQLLPWPGLAWVYIETNIEVGCNFNWIINYYPLLCLKWSRFENWFGPIGIGVDMMAERMHI